MFVTPRSRFARAIAPIVAGLVLLTPAALPAAAQTQSSQPPQPPVPAASNPAPVAPTSALNPASVANPAPSAVSAVGPTQGQPTTVRPDAGITPPPALSAVTPCEPDVACPYVSRTTGGWDVDTGGPGVFFEMTDED